MTDSIQIEIVSDVVCPWCIIGYRSLQNALEEAGLSSVVDIRWRPFELNPQMPAEGQDIGEHIQQKYGASPEQSAANRAGIKQRGEEVGYRFDFADKGRIYNTFDAHRLIHWAGEFGLQTEMKLRLFDLYFQQHSNPSDHEALLKCAEDVGLDRAAAAELLASDRFVSEVRAEEEKAWQQGISAVPAFIFNDQYLISGAQPQQAFQQMFDKLAETA